MTTISLGAVLGHEYVQHISHSYKKFNVTKNHTELSYCDRASSVHSIRNEKTNHGSTVVSVKESWLIIQSIEHAS